MTTMMGYPEETGYGTYITNLYKNNGDNSFTLQTGMNFPGVREGDLNWGDYNNDGFLDFIITGDSHEYDDYTEIYKNNGDGTFTVQSNISLPELSYESDAAWGDYNNDGFLDLLLSGPSSPNNVTKLYVNNQDGTFTELTNTNFKGLEEPTLAWGDYNNDGFPDIISIGQSASGVFTTIYKNNQDGTFTEQIDINLQDVYMGDVHWGDYDNDNDLDLIITGYDPTPGQHEVTNIYENHTLEKNTPPSSPTNLSASLTGEGVVTLSWDAATDAETPSDGLSYNIYVGSSPGTNDIVTPMANISNGFRRIPALGNTNMNTSWTIKNLDMGTYYWSVQAIDQSFAGSPFASEGSFTISHIPDSLPGNALTFDGVDDYVEVPDNSSLNSNSFTVEFWFKPEVLQIQNLVRKQNPGSGDLYWRIFMADVNGSVEFDALPGEVANCKALNVAYVDTWLHIATTYDNAGQEVRIYANGELKSTVTDISDMGNASDMGIRFSHTSSQLQGILDEYAFGMFAGQSNRSANICM